jgi:hypothetical protein
VVVFAFAYKDEFSSRGDEAGMADARKAPPATHFCPDRLDHASQSVSEEPVRPYGRVRTIFLTGSVIGR